MNPQDEWIPIIMLFEAHTHTTVLTCHFIPSLKTTGVWKQTSCSHFSLHAGETLQKRQSGLKWSTRPHRGCWVVLMHLNHCFGGETQLRFNRLFSDSSRRLSGTSEGFRDFRLQWWIRALCRTDGQSRSTKTWVLCRQCSVPSSQPRNSLVAPGGGGGGGGGGGVLLFTADLFFVFWFCRVLFWLRHNDTAQVNIHLCRMTTWHVLIHTWHCDKQICQPDSSRTQPPPCCTLRYHSFSCSIKTIHWLLMFLTPRLLLGPLHQLSTGNNCKGKKWIVNRKCSKDVLEDILPGDNMHLTSIMSWINKHVHPP